MLTPRTGVQLSLSNRNACPSKHTSSNDFSGLLIFTAALREQRRVSVARTVLDQLFFCPKTFLGEIRGY